MAFNRRPRHNVPGLDTTSTADISFMLLIFFLVTTSMDLDKGLSRQLPPIDTEHQEAMQDINKDAVLTIKLQKDGQLSLDEGRQTIRRDDYETVRKEIRHFVISRGARHVIELQVPRDATYDDYFHLQNQLVKAYSEIRDAASRKKYGTAYNELDEVLKETILKFYPQRVQEVSTTE